jgi:hypothetical protein
MPSHLRLSFTWDSKWLALSVSSWEKKNRIVDSVYVNDWYVLTESHHTHRKYGFDTHRLQRTKMTLSAIDRFSWSTELFSLAASTKWFMNCSIELNLRIGCTELMCILIGNEMISWLVSESFVCVQHRSIQRWMITVNVSIESLLRRILSFIECWKKRP